MHPPSSTTSGSYKKSDSNQSSVTGGESQSHQSKKNKPGVNNTNGSFGVPMGSISPGSSQNVTKDVETVGTAESKGKKSGKRKKNNKASNEEQ